MAASQVTESPYGTWRSPITSELIVSGIIALGEVRLEGDDIYWIEQRPLENGRYVIVRRTPDGKIADVTPAGFNARTRVHEYGGGAYVLDGRTVYFSNYDDQRLYRQDPDAAPRPITPAVDLRYADGVIDKRRKRILSVREDHTGTGQAVNTIVSLRFDEDKDGGRVLVSGNDFYSNPRLSPDGQRLAWLTWNHPNMPWDGTELWVGEVDETGNVAKSEKVAGGLDESIFQPEWSPDGTLYFISDKSGWWNLYRRRGDSIEPMQEMEAEFGVPQWVFGLSTYSFESAERIICTYSGKRGAQLGRLDTIKRTLTARETPYTSITNVRAAPGRAAFIGGSPTQPFSIVLYDLNTQQFSVLRRSTEITVDSGYLSIPQAIEFPTENGKTAHAYYYPPKNRSFAAPRGEKPPLLVNSHGGPTGATSSVFNLSIQYWTSRGFAVVDVNYGGSTGYGREYRRRLNGAWGVVDVVDCANAARYLIRQGLADPNRVVIRGGSAGGYTTLTALASTDVFKAGASHFGIGDLEVFADTTHKFESRYLDHLVGPFPVKRDLYRERSAIQHMDRFTRPLILFQGLEDEIVPPNQAELMVKALQEKKIPVAYLAYPGEQHGFRRAENIKRTLDAELYFHGKVFGFQPADEIDPVTIENLENR